MKRLLILFAIAAGGFLVTPQRASAAPTPSTLDFSFHFGYFYNSLRPHGEWIELDDGVFVWRPYRVRIGWRPYMLGRWVWTDYGWYWMSREPFGWVTYHYGRWYDDEYYGWVWVPDDVWGPSWVEFRYTDDYVGWAPLPPYAGFHVSFGLRFTREWVAPVHYWNVVRVNAFGNEIRYRDVQSTEYARRLSGSGRTARNFEYRDQRVVNQGIDPTFFERRGNSHIERVQVTGASNGSGERFVRDGNRRNARIEVYRPTPTELQSVPGRIEARRGERRTTMDLGSISRQRDPGTTETQRNATAPSPADQRRTGVQRSPSQSQPSGQTPQRSPEQRRPQYRQESSTPDVPAQRNRELSRPRTRQTPTVEKRDEQRQERRRELIQRNERSTPTPPARRSESGVRQQARPMKESMPSPQRSGSERGNERRH